MIHCPKPSLPFKCLCLGDGVRGDGRRGDGGRGDGRRVRGRGVIEGDTCNCGDINKTLPGNNSVTRAVCCHRGVINIV